MVNFLVFSQAFVNNLFDGPYRPENREVVHNVRWLLLNRRRSLNITKAIVFERVADDLDIAIVQVEVVPVVRWQLRAHLDRILVRSEHKPVPLHLALALISVIVDELFGQKVVVCLMPQQSC